MSHNVLQPWDSWDCVGLIPASHVALVILGTLGLWDRSHVRLYGPWRGLHSNPAVINAGRPVKSVMYGKGVGRNRCRTVFTAHIFPSSIVDVKSIYK
jgi:hypothetical protein